MFILTVFLTVVYGYTGYHNWTSSTGPVKENLLCPDTCISRDHYDRCCTCNARPVWEVDTNIAYTPVYLEYLDITGCSSLVLYDQSFYVVFQWLDYQFGSLYYLPNNICLYNGTLVTVNLKGNRLQHIEGVACLTLLDTLIVSENNIRYVTNQTFEGMTNLRVLEMSNCGIKTLSNNVIRQSTIEIFYIDFSMNNFTSVDISNIIGNLSAFCLYSFQNSQIKNFKNVNKFTLNSDGVYGGGEINFDYCDLEGGHPFTVITDSADNRKNFYMYMYANYEMYGRLSMTGVDAPCDCLIGRMLTTNLDLFKKFYYKNDYICTSPQNMKGKYMIDAFNDTSLLDEFVCTKTEFDSCPSFCVCFEQPSRMRMLVDCSYRNLTEMPRWIPLTRYDVELNLSHNFISQIYYRNYLRNISVIDLSGNIITNIDNSVPENLDIIQNIYIPDHNLMKLPNNMKLITAYKIWFGQNSIPCGCNDKWIGLWRTTSNVNASNPLYCQIDIDGHSYKYLAEVAFDYLSCSPDTEVSLPLSVGLTLLALVLLTMFLMNQFRYDILILKALLIRRIKKNSRHYEYDVYFSYDDQPDVSKYVLEMYRDLNGKGNRCFIPELHSQVGVPIETEIYKNLPLCNTVIVFLSVPQQHREYENLFELEFFQAWKHFVSCEIDNLLIVNFEGKFSLQRKTFPFVSALLRFNHVYKMTHRHYNVTTRITTLLGKPGEKPDSHCMTISSNYNTLSVFDVCS